MPHGVAPGRPNPLGASIVREGVNFSVYSRHATRVELLLFDRVDDGRPARVIPLEPPVHRTYHYWHVRMPGLEAGQLYGYRVHGPFDLARGFRFDPSKVLLDPYGRGVAVPDGYDRGAAVRPGDNAATAMKSVVVDLHGYDWEGDAPLHRPVVHTVIYEMHVRGFTRHPSSGVAEARRGTYAGLVEKIPHLRDLGVNAVELLPIFHFDPHDAPPGRTNYWGYAPVSFFAPHPAYSSRRDPLGPVDEFRDMVKALHRAGIEVILDVVFNHTTEGDHRGPTLCFRGFENPAYYLLEPNREYYSNYTGTGNTLNGNDPIVRRLILDSLRYWVSAMHVDGFRFDLASILSRDEAGRPLANPPVLWDIESDPVLAGTKLIAEAWDAAGLYQVGSFVGDSWMEWNGRFRDDVRDFLRGVPGMTGRLASRLLGSPDIYAHEEREAEQSVNFVTCHDGFTLNDLVSYDRKHNEANGEGNRDGMDDNRSWNGGVEGPSDDPAVERLRDRQVRNGYAITLLALGVPMLLMGDEIRRTQGGNNNAYAQDNETGWLDWSGVRARAGLLRFVRMLVAHRIRFDDDPERDRMTLNQLLRASRFEWHGAACGKPDWGPESRCIALGTAVRDGTLRMHAMFNANAGPVDFELPAVPAGAAWRRWIDTGLESPHDIMEWRKAPPIAGATVRVAPYAIVVAYAPAG